MVRMPLTVTLLTRNSRTPSQFVTIKTRGGKSQNVGTGSPHYLSLDIGPKKKVFCSEPCVECITKFDT